MIAVVGRDQSAGPPVAGSTGLFDMRARRVFDVIAPGENLIRLDPADAALAHGPVPQSFHLLATGYAVALWSGD